MKIGENNIQFSKLLKSWRSCGELFFYAQFLGESRKPILNASTTLKKKSRYSSIRHYVSAIFRKPIYFADLIVLLWRCLCAPKNRVLIFNHSSRRRMTAFGNKSLYLSPDSFDLESKIIFEDCACDFVYPSGAIKLNSGAVDGCIGLLVRLMSIYTMVFYRFRDKDICFFILKFKLWKFILWLLRPKRVQVMVWYGKEPVIAACKELDIEIWDMQHGIIYEEHPIYNLTVANTVTGSHYLLPDKCLVYGEYWKQNLLKSGWSEASVEVAGYFPDVNIGYEHIADAPYVLYTSQPQSNKMIVEHIRMISAELQSRGWLVIIALHPSESSDGYKEILSDRVRITKFDSYDLLRNCAVHVSFGSTLLWEAILFGKSNFILQYGQVAVGLLGDLVRFGYGRSLADGEFPEPFELPHIPPRDYFFAEVNKVLLNN